MPKRNIMSVGRQRRGRLNVSIMAKGGQLKVSVWYPSSNLEGGWEGPEILCGHLLNLDSMSGAEVLDVYGNGQVCPIC